MRMFASLYNYRAATNPQVFLQVSRDGKPLGKMVFEVNIYSTYLIFFKIVICQSLP